MFHRSVSPCQAASWKYCLYRVCTWFKCAHCANSRSFKCAQSNLNLWKAQDHEKLPKIFSWDLAMIFYKVSSNLLPLLLCLPSLLTIIDTYSELFIFSAFLTVQNICAYLFKDLLYFDILIMPFPIAALLWWWRMHVMATRELALRQMDFSGSANAFLTRWKSHLRGWCLWWACGNVTCANGLLHFYLIRHNIWIRNASNLSRGENVAGCETRMWRARAIKVVHQPPAASLRLHTWDLHILAYFEFKHICETSLQTWNIYIYSCPF